MSRTRSSPSSTPQLRRIRSSPMPRVARSAGGMEPWVIRDGSSARDSTPPRDSASVKRRKEEKKASAVACVASAGRERSESAESSDVGDEGAERGRMRKETMPP